MPSGSPQRTAALNLILAGSYLALGNAGHLLALKPSDAALIWPPAGFAFAACMKWGSGRVWPGIMLGAFLATAAAGETFHASGAALVLAIGSTLQAVLGATQLVRVDKDFALHDGFGIASLVRVTATSCLVAAIVSHAGLFLLGLVNTTNFTRSFAERWLADVLGVLIFLPLTLSLIDPRRLWRRRRAQVGIPLLASALLSALAYRISGNEESFQLTNDFSRQADVLLTAFTEFDESSSKPVKVLAAMASQPENRTVDRFLSLAASLRQQYLIVQSLNWIPFVRQESRRTFETEASRQLGRAVVVTPVSGHTFLKSGWMAPVMLIEPLAGNEPALGRDMLSESVRADAIQKSWNTRQVTATAKITLVQDTEGPGGILVNAPVVSEGGVAGVMTAVVNLRSLLKPLRAANGVQWHLSDLTSNSLVHATLVEPPSFSGRTYTDRAGVYLNRTFTITDRALRIVLYKPYSAFPASLVSHAKLVLVMGTTTCAGLVLFMLLVTANTEQMEIDLAGRKRAEQNLRTALGEKEVLLKEIYHRVKNNLQVVSSLLNLQSRRVSDGSTKQLLDDSANRVKSMALVHEQLYRSENLSNIRLRDYFLELAENLKKVNEPLSTRVTLRVEVEEQSVGVERAIPLGLVVNELVSNAYRHGYEPSAARGEIVVRFALVSDSLVRLEVSDDGRGLPADFLPAKGGALGLQLVRTLAAQLNADLTWNAGDRGACFALTFDARTPAEQQIVGS